MTSKNPNKTLTPVQNDSEPTTAERPQVRRELTDDEIAAVAGGYQSTLYPSSPPSGGPIKTGQGKNPR